MKIFYLFFLILLASCTAGIDMKPVKYDNLFHDDNSKVWMINKMIVNKKNLTSPDDVNKEVLIFYVDGTVQYVPLKDLGTDQGNVGNYILQSDDKSLAIYFKESVWDFKLKKITEDTIYMTSSKESDRNLSLEIVPLPKILH
tara:strand:+ start:2342 stop:2767 length:426 start_codon:yes stop_codon:yes gene_type:complete